MRLPPGRAARSSSRRCGAGAVELLLERREVELVVARHPLGVDVERTHLHLVAQQQAHVRPAEPQRMDGELRAAQATADHDEPAAPAWPRERGRAGAPSCRRTPHEPAQQRQPAGPRRHGADEPPRGALRRPRPHPRTVTGAGGAEVGGVEDDRARQHRRVTPLGQPARHAEHPAVAEREHNAGTPQARAALKVELEAASRERTHVHHAPANQAALERATAEVARHRRTEVLEEGGRRRGPAVAARQRRQLSSPTLRPSKGEQRVVDDARGVRMDERRRPQLCDALRAQLAPPLVEPAAGGVDDTRPLEQRAPPLPLDRGAAAALARVACEARDDREPGWAGADDHELEGGARHRGGSVLRGASHRHAHKAGAATAGSPGCARASRRAIWRGGSAYESERVRAAERSQARWLSGAAGLRRAHDCERLGTRGCAWP